MTLSTTSAAKVLQPETVVAEVVMNIDALAVSEPNPQELAHVVLRELSKSVDCFSAKPQGKALRMQCNDHAKVTPWPPKSGRDVANTVKAAFALISHHRCDRATGKIDPSNRMVLRVGYVQRLVGVDRDSFWPSERRQFGVCPIATEALLTGTGHMIDTVIVKVESPDTVPFPQDDPQILIINC